VSARGTCGSGSGINPLGCMRLCLCSFAIIQAIRAQSPGKLPAKSMLSRNRD
jgi:hypothetical protein